MLRQCWHVLACLLILSVSINAQDVSTTVSPSTVIGNTTEELVEPTSTIIPDTTTIGNIETTPSDFLSTTVSTLADSTETSVFVTTDANTSSTTILETTSSSIVTEPGTTMPLELQTTTPVGMENTSIPQLELVTATTLVTEGTTTVSIEPETTASSTIEETTTVSLDLDTSTSAGAENTTFDDYGEVYPTDDYPGHLADLLTTERSNFDEVTSTAMSVGNTSNYFPHLGKPNWTHVEPSKPQFANDYTTSSTHDLLHKIIRNLAAYIIGTTNDVGQVDLSALADSITDELKDKIDLSGLDFDSDDLEAINGIAKVFIKNLSFIIKTFISKLDKVGDENCPIKFTFLNTVYCINFEHHQTSPLTPPIPVSWPPTSSTTTASNVTVESFKVFNLNHVDTPPTSWKQWINPPQAQDQSISTPAKPAIVCYYTNWAQYRNGLGRFYPENLDPSLCTHINYAFAQLRDGVVAPYEWNDESTAWSVGMYDRIMKLRQSGQPKILLAIGGWNFGSGKFSDMVRNETKRATFISTTIIFLQKHRFDGLDIDWEYPGSREGSRPSDKEAFTKLLIELKTAFRPYSLLLTAAVGAGKPTIDAAYDIPRVCDNLDLVNLMSYDLHGSWESQTGINSPLYSRANASELNKQLTQDWAVRYWIDNGCSPSKLVMGLALYGRTFRLASASDHQIGAAAVGPGAAGLYTGEGGFLAYYEICTRVQQQNWTKVYDDEQKSNYAYKGLEWVGYDDVYTIGLKVQYAKQMALAGIMFWAPDLDDFTGALCGEGKYPLMNTAVNLIRGQTVWTPSPSPTTSTTSTTTTTTSTTSTTTTSTGVTTSQPRKRVVCYFTNWAQYRPDGGKFLPENLDASLCTHIIYAFAVLKDSKLAPFEWNDEDPQWSAGQGLYSRFIALGKKSGVKVLLAVGGWNFGSGPFSDMVRNETLRKAFVQQATQFIQDHQFDGLDIDWEYPGSRDGSRPEDKRLFTSLVKELRAAFTPYDLLLTAAVGAGASTIEKGYEIDQIAPHLDFINLMTYDLHGGSWENITGLHTALYARPNENETEMTLNQNWAVNYWIQQGMPKEKVSMGLATYGRTFTLVNSSITGIGAPSSGPGEAGKYTREPGFLSYYEICEKLNSGLWTSKYDDVQKSMYAYGEGQWVGYDNVDTLSIRANYIIGKGLGGALIWAPDLDDFSGQFCNRGRYPLMNTVVNLLRTNTIVPIVIPTPPTTTTTIMTTTTTATTTTTVSSSTLSSTSTPVTPLPIVPPPTNVSSPSVVCMTSVNPFVFHTLNVNLCSHLILVQTEFPSDDTDLFQSALASDTLEQVKTMKSTNSRLKVFYSILGRFKVKHLTLLRDDQQRTAFNQNLRQYLIDNHLDGFDLDWIIKPEQVTSLTDRNLLSTWLLELRSLFAPNQLSLSIGVSGDKDVIDNCYEFGQLAKTVDFIRLMAFDWPSTNVTSLINPLFPRDKQSSVDQFTNINWAVMYFSFLGLPWERISLGLPTYGRLFGLADGNQNSIGAPTIGSSIPLAYSDICKLLKSNDYINSYNQPTRSSFVYNEKKKRWISYDTVNDMALKARFAKLQGLGGVTLSSIVMDDVDGQCGQGVYPLLHAVADVFDLPSNKQLSPKVVDSRNRNVRRKNVFCSVSSKASTLDAPIPFTLDKIHARLCTHLLIDRQSPLLSAVVSDQLRAANSDLKIFLIVDADEQLNSKPWKSWIEEKKADGINVNINANAFSNQTIEQIKAIRSALSTDYLLTITFQIPIDPNHQLFFFNILGLHSYVDYLILLPFDSQAIANFQEIQPWNSLASFIQPDSEKNIGDFSIVSALMFILSAGVPKEKLILSVPTYGLTFLLADQNKFKMGDPITGQGLPGPITQTKGMLASYEICDLLDRDHYDRFLTSESVIVVAHQEKNLILFDDTQPLQLQTTVIVNGTVDLKASFIEKAQLGGVLVHSIDMDDYTGSFCHRGAFPITSIVSRVFSTSSRVTKPATTIETPVKEKSTNNICSGIQTQDLIADERDRRYYYVCMPNTDQPLAHLQCPNDMSFSSKRKACIKE